MHSGSESGDLVASDHVGLEGLLELEAEWRRLAALADRAMLCHDFDWARLYLAHLRRMGAEPSSAGRLLVVALRSRDGTVRAICPLEAGAATIRRVRFTAWRLLAIENSCDLLVEPGTSADCVLLALRDHLVRGSRRRSLLVVSPISPNTAAARAAAAGTSWCPAGRAAHPGYCVIDTRRAFGTLNAGFGKNFRGNLRKARNKLAAERGVRFRMDRDPEGNRDIFRELVRIEAEGWKGEGGASTAMRQVPASLAFHEALVTTVSREHRPEMRSLWIGDRCIAAQLWVRYRDIMVAVKISYDQAYSRLSPGQLLFESVLESCCEDPAIAQVDVMTRQPWHQTWNAAVVECCEFYLPLQPLRGALACGLLYLPQASRLAELVTRQRR